MQDTSIALTYDFDKKYVITSVYIYVKSTFREYASFYANVENKTKPSRRRSVCKNRRNFRRAAAGWAASDTMREKGAKERSAAPFRLAYSLSRNRGEWLTFRRPRRCSSGRVRLPSKYWFARSRNARVATRVVSSGLLADAFVQTFILGLLSPLEPEFPSRHLACLHPRWNLAKSFKDFLSFSEFREKFYMN